MIINGYDYHFAYTVGAFCTIADMKLPIVKTVVDQCKVITQMAIVMSKAYEDKAHLEDSGYKVRYLTREEVSALSIEEVIEKLTPEVDEAVAKGKYRQIKAKYEKNEEARLDN